MENSARFFCNRDCEYFPCHEGADTEAFNCLFCYCPLYALGPRCGGNFCYMESGIKDCSACLFPHRPESYDSILSRYREIVEMMKKQDNDPVYAVQEENNHEE